MATQQRLFTRPKENKNKQQIDQHRHSKKKKEKKKWTHEYLSVFISVSDSIYAIALIALK